MLEKAEMKRGDEEVARKSWWSGFAGKTHGRLWGKWGGREEDVSSDDGRGMKFVASDGKIK